jgi:hypothetical protein
MNPNERQHVRTVLFPKSSAEIIDNWQVIGLRGIGSDSYRVEDLFVRQKYTFSRDNPAERREVERVLPKLPAPPDRTPASASRTWRTRYAPILMRRWQASGRALVA